MYTKLVFFMNYKITNLLMWGEYVTHIYPLPSIPRPGITGLVEGLWAVEHSMRRTCIPVEYFTLFILLFVRKGNEKNPSMIPNWALLCLCTSSRLCAVDAIEWKWWWYSSLLSWYNIEVDELMYVHAHRGCLSMMGIFRMWGRVVEAIMVVVVMMLILRLRIRWRWRWL